MCVLYTSRLQKELIVTVYDCRTGIFFNGISYTTLDQLQYNTWRKLTSFSQSNSMPFTQVICSRRYSIERSLITHGHPCIILPIKRWNYVYSIFLFLKLVCNNVVYLFFVKLLLCQQRKAHFINIALLLLNNYFCLVLR